MVVCLFFSVSVALLALKGVVGLGVGPGTCFLRYLSWLALGFFVFLITHGSVLLRLLLTSR